LVFAPTNTAWLSGRIEGYLAASLTDQTTIPSLPTTERPGLMDLLHQIFLLAFGASMAASNAARQCKSEFGIEELHQESASNGPDNGVKQKKLLHNSDIGAKIRPYQYFFWHSPMLDAAFGH
jgi:hypothetical protein